MTHNNDIYWSYHVKCNTKVASLIEQRDSLEITAKVPALKKPLPGWSPIAPRIWHTPLINDCFYCSGCLLATPMGQCKRAKVGMILISTVLIDTLAQFLLSEFKTLVSVGLESP